MVSVDPNRCFHSVLYVSGQQHLASRAPLCFGDATCPWFPSYFSGYFLCLIDGPFFHLLSLQYWCPQGPFPGLFHTGVQNLCLQGQTFDSRVTSTQFTYSLALWTPHLALLQANSYQVPATVPSNPIKFLHFMPFWIAIKAS